MIGNDRINNDNIYSSNNNDNDKTIIDNDRISNDNIYSSKN